MKVLVIGKSTRNIVCSAKKAGHTVYALDQFGDIDTLKFSDKTVLFGEVTKKEIYELALSFGNVDAVILGTGFEKLELENVMNNPVDVIESVNDKLDISRKFRSMDIPHPRTAKIENAGTLGFPLMVKPRSGSGGILNLTIRDRDELEAFKERSDSGEFIAQEFVRGIPCSVSLISSGDNAAVLAVNEQFIGTPWLTRIPFAYCGNITPFYSDFNDMMIEYAKKISSKLKLKGSNGVDFMLTENGPVVIEVNPRFQGSLDTVEISTGINIFNAHVRSFSGELPGPGEPVCFAARTIVFADREVIIDNKISDKLLRCMEKGRATDIPHAGWTVRPDEPVTSLLEKSDTREKVLENIRNSSGYIKKLTEA